MGTGNREQDQVSRAKRDAPQGRRRLNFAASAAKKKFGGGESLREQGTGNREQGTGNMPCSPSVPGTCSGTTPGKPIAAIFHHFGTIGRCLFFSVNRAVVGV